MGESIDWKRVTAIWRASGRTSATVAAYEYWARRYVRHCKARGLSPLECLTCAQVAQYTGAEVPVRHRRRTGSFSATLVRSGAHALWCALGTLGHQVPPWRDERPTAPMPLLVRSFVEYRLRDHGVAPSTSPRDAQVAAAFLVWIRERKRRVAGIRVIDVDEFVTDCGRKWAPKTVAGVCSTLKAFLRYLHATGRVAVDLAGSVMGPRIRWGDRPPRALAWPQVRRILKGIDPRARLGRRDFAMFLMMATYGMGAGEIIGLRLEDVDWNARTIRVRRPKTGTVTMLPLLGPIARALALYLRDGRPAHTQDRAVFVSDIMPHAALGSSGPVRHRLIACAAAAGVQADFLGSHVFRHTHATRQIESGVAPKIVGDILGHRRPESTSAYVRGAILKLRTVALPVPR